ncbi:MAG: GCN5-related N-acetyltransferase [Hyphomicrobiales bacterium]|nr:GCN5-related N-acetyltransferase [Hyphomicrobiales bacterium]
MSKTETEVRAAWRDLIERRMPLAAARRADWPVRLDHCFARILLDNACGRPWREVIPAPAWRSAPPDILARATQLGERALAGETDLPALNARSLALRGKLKR